MTGLDAQTVEFLQGKHFAKLATVKKDGSPHVTPIWYMLENGKLFINTTTDRLKFRNISRDPRVSLLVDDGYPYVIVEGKGRIAKERDPKMDIETLAIRYTGEEAGRKSARERFWKMDRITIEVVPEKVIKDL